MPEIRWLFDNGYLHGIKHSPVAKGSIFLKLQITNKGLELLKQETQELVKKNSRQTRYETEHPMFAKVAVAVASSLIVATILFFFGLIPIR